MNEQIDHVRDVFEGVKLGTGAWAWGDSLFWGYGRDYSEIDVYEAFQASLEAGITFFDTAEAYGMGRSERLLGRFIKRAGQDVTVATKFMPFPWRLQPASLINALRKSLKRLDMEQVDLYQIHWPFPPVAVETWMGALADAVLAGLVRAVGVSNYGPGKTQRAYDALAGRGISLASNQVEYSLLNRKIERSGLLDLCRRLNVRVIAYSPLGQGLLTGKYTPENPPAGIRGLRSRRQLKRVQPLIALMHEIGQGHGDKTPAQVALNWTIRKGALPIPGAKNADQLRQNAGAVGWALTPDEVAALDAASDAAR
jgi:aryl-alcohol dehydrogenase-like predicted oxidoreductase